MRQLGFRILAPTALLAALACSAGDSAQSAAFTDSGAEPAVAPAPAPPHATPAREMAAPPVAMMASARRSAADGAILESAGAPAGQATSTGARIADVRPGAMVIRSATASVEVRSLDEAVAAARRAATRLGGEVANAQITSGRHELKRASLQILIPTFRFDSLVTGLGPLGHVESVQVSAQDVGEEYVDLESRLANLRRLEQRIIELLATRAGKLADVLSVEQELARVRGEIEQAEGRRRYLARWVSVSTLNLILHEPAPVLAESVGGNPIAAAFRQAWRQLVGTVAWAITFLGTLIPLVVLFVPLGLIARHLWQRRQGSSGATA